MCGLVNWEPRGDPEQKCVRLKYVLSYSPPEQATEGGEEGRRAKDANPNAVPGLCANTERAMGSRKHWEVIHFS